MSRQARWAALAVAASVLSGCAAPPPPPLVLHHYSIRSGALDVDVPDGWGDPFSWRVARPNGIGLLIIQRNPTTVRVAVSASATALRETPDRFAPTWVTTFPRQLDGAVDLADFQIDAGDCGPGVIRPLAGGRWYGRLISFRGCRNDESVSRYVSIDADRTVLLSIEARAQPGGDADVVVRQVLAGVAVDPFALPVATVVEDDLDVIE